MLRTEFSTNSISCSIFPKCPGCKLQTDVRSPPIWQEVLKFFQSLGLSLSLELISKEITEWRSKAKLAIRGTINLPQIGLFEEGSHLVVDMLSCPLHYPVMNEALSFIRQKMIAFQIEPYKEKEGGGRLRYLQMLVDRKTLKIQLSLVFNAEALRENELLFIEELSREKNIWHSIWINYLGEATNTILGNRWNFVFGKEDFYQEIRGISFCFHPSSFSQSHLSVFEEMLNYIESLISEGGSVLELYAGVGCIGLSVAHKSRKMVLVESSPQAKHCFEKSLSRLSLDIQEKCSFVSNSAESDSFSFEGVDTIIVDPPRKGLSKKCKEKVFRSDATQLIYVSCGPLSFMRDCKEFLEEGWFLEDVKGFLLFPGSDQVELIADFKKR